MLSSRLARAAPVDLRDDERAALARVLATAGGVRDAQTERDRLAEQRLRPRLDAFIAAWSAMDDALGATARLPARVSPLGARARALRASLFPDGVGFVHARAERAWSEGRRLLTRVVDESLGVEIGDILGPAFLDAAQVATDELADIIGTGENSPTRTPEGVAEALGRFGAAVGAYARLLLAHCDPDDDASLARLRAAVAPIDQHRARHRPSASSAPSSEQAAPAATAAPTPVSLAFAPEA